LEGSGRRLIEVLSQHFPGETEEEHRKPQYASVAGPNAGPQATLSPPAAVCGQPPSMLAAPLIVIDARVVTPAAIRLVLNANLAVLGLVPGLLRKQSQQFVFFSGSSSRHGLHKVTDSVFRVCLQSAARKTLWRRPLAGHVRRVCLLLVPVGVLSVTEWKSVERCHQQGILNQRVKIG
jgi:hypothetical protein